MVNEEIIIAEEVVSIVFSLNDARNYSPSFFQRGGEGEFALKA